MTAVENGKQDSSSFSKTRSGAAKVAIGCSIVTAVLLLAIAAVVIVFVVRDSRSAERQQKQHAADTAEMFSPAVETMQTAASRSPHMPVGRYDIDATIRVMHELDLWMEHDFDLRTYLQYVASHDYQHVAPELLRARAEILRLWMELYARQAEDQKAAWLSLRRIWLEVMQCSNFNPAGAFFIDKAGVQERLSAVEKEVAGHQALLADIELKKQRLLEASFKYAEIYYKYVVEWDRLCLLRDRAYLACHNQDWKAAVKSADKAIALAPLEREAHILKAMALIETDGDEALDQAAGILNAYVEDYPQLSAPALLLQAVLATRLKNQTEAKLRFQQASAYYPRQADQLLDMLDAYKWRAFLRQSREGLYILKLYKSTMLGAGYFSSDLHMARDHFAVGRRSEGQQKVLDHFSRRRQQARKSDSQWELLVEDMKFCEDFLGADFSGILPEAYYLDLVPRRGIIGDKLHFNVTNRSDITLHNVSLVLCLRYTDMVLGDYDPRSPATLPKLEKLTTTKLEPFSASKVLLGLTKGADDIVLDSCRAVLVADEAVAWVDTEAFKQARFKASDADARSTMQGDDGGAGPSKHLMATWPSLVQDIQKDILVTLGSGIGNDDIDIRIPGHLAVAKPVFRMSYGSGSEGVAPTHNNIRDRIIHLTFASVADFDGKDQLLPIHLTIHTSRGTVSLRLE